MLAYTNYQKNLYFIAIVSLFQFCCKSENLETKSLSPKIISIKENYINRDNKKATKLSDLMAEYKLIELERTDKANIGNIDKIIEYENKFYILDKSSAKCVFVFNIDGRFLFRIGNKNQFENPDDLLINKKKQEVNILDGGGKKIARYDLEGKYLGEISLNFLSKNFELCNDWLAFIGGGQEDNLIVTNPKGKRENSFFPLDQQNKFRLIDPFTNVGDTLLYYKEYLNDTLYRVKKNFVYPSIIIDFGKKTFTKKAFDSINSIIKIKGDIQKPVVPPDNYMSQIIFFLENKSFIYFTFQYQGQTNYVIYSKSSKKIKIFSNGIINDIMFDEYPPLTIATHQEEFIATVQPYSLLKSIEAIKKEDKERMDSTAKERFNNIKQLIKNMNELSNPILMIFKFKQF